MAYPKGVLGYFGPAGTFTHQALLTITDEEAMPFASVPEALDAVREGQVDGVVAAPRLAGGSLSS